MYFTQLPNGGKLTLTKTIKKNYKAITKPLLEAKSAFIAMCADIDRYIRLATGCEIGKEQDETAVSELRELFPYLSGLSVDQWNRLMLVFLNIRNVNAHLYQNRPVFIDADILAYLNALVLPEMDAVANGNELTVYGAYYVLSFLSQRFQIWTFICLLLRGQIFNDMGKKEFHAFQVKSQHLLQEYGGIGKPIGRASGLHMTSLMHINDTLRRELTSVFLGLEAEAINRGFALKISPSFRGILKNIHEIEEGSELSNRLINLRNVWFHGHWLEDEVELHNGTKGKFDFYETIDTLRMLHDALIYNERYNAVTGQIESFGKALLDMKVLRLVEVSYKLLDSRLLTAEKFEERVNNLNKSYTAFSATDDRFFQAASSLLGSGPAKWKLSAAKFSNVDYFPRSTTTDELRVIVLECESGFDIGDFHTDAKTLTFCDVTLPEEFLLPINGRKLADYPLELERDICPRLKVYRAIK